MAIATIISSLFIFISLILTLDTYSFYTRIQAIDGAGVGLHLFFGLVEINDHISTDQAGAYLADLMDITKTSWALTLAICALSIGIYLYSRHHKQHTR